MDDSLLHQGVERLSDELCKTIGGNFDFNVSLGLRDDSVEKLCMLVNFMLDTSRRTLSELSRRNEQLAEMDRLRSEFFANVSHELRTPLTLILAPVQSLLSDLRESPLSARDLASLSIIHNNASRLLQLVNGLLDFSKLEAGRLEPNREPIRIEELTRLLLEDFEPLMRERKIKSSFAATVDHPVILLDRYLYERIVFNLVANAIKFTPEGGRVSIALELKDSSRMRVMVSDTGIGIAEENMKNLFHKFRQLEGSSTRRFEGTGLGLAMVKEFSELLGGEVKVQSSFGQGSTFTVELPVDPSMESVTGGPMMRSSCIPFVPLPSDSGVAVHLPAKHFPSEGRVLIAEDNPDLAAYIASQLNETYEIRIAVDGERAFTVARDWRPDLILTDVMMPKIDGLDLCRAIKQDADLAAIPVVLLTALTHREALLEGWEAGADDYLFKPFNPLELKARVRSILRLAQARHRAEDHRVELAREQGKRAEAEANLERLQRTEAELRRTNRVKDEFLAAISHELRTPMNVIIGWTEMLVHHELAAEEHDQIYEVLNRNAKAQAKLIEDLLDISRITTGKLAVNIKPVRLTEIVEEAVSNMRLAAEAKQIKVEVFAEKAIGPVAGDAERLQQVIWNLLSNAIKFTPAKGAVQIVLAAHQGRVSVTVRDNGPGIDKDFLPFVFERFLQEETGKTRRFSGLGLGLSIAKHITELHGGTISVESAGKGQGSAFRVELPLMSAPQLASGEAAAAKRPDRSDMLRGVRALVVDDEPDARALVARVLRAGGAEVSEAASAAEALAHFKQQRPTVLLSDISMPEEDGCSLIRKIRAQDARSGAHLPAMALTAFASETEREKTRAAGFELHMAKPVLPDQLVDEVAKLAQI